MAVVYNGKHHRNPSGHTNRVKWLLSMCNWNSAHLGDVFQYIKDPTPHDDNAAHFAWKKRWVEAYKEAQWWIKIGGRYYRKQHRLEKQVENLKIDYSILQRKNNSLEERIEKMKKLIPKTCDVCVGWGCHARCVDCDFKDKWKLKE